MQADHSALIGYLRESCRIIPSALPSNLLRLSASLTKHQLHPVKGYELCLEQKLLMISQ